MNTWINTTIDSPNKTYTGLYFSVIAAEKKTLVVKQAKRMTYTALPCPLWIQKQQPGLQQKDSGFEVDLEAQVSFFFLSPEKCFLIQDFKYRSIRVRREKISIVLWNRQEGVG